jgi:hypothetical protein
MATSRRNRKNTLPKATLERARQQAGMQPAEETEIEDESEPTESAAIRPEKASSRRPAARSRITSMSQIERARSRGELDQEMVRDLLANPIRQVSEEELHRDYAHVLIDLRNMGLLSAALIAALVILSFIL